MILNVLKKYSRAAGDRNQWRKVEAMFSGMRSKRPSEYLVGGRGCHVTRD